MSTYKTVVVGVQPGTLLPQGAFEKVTDEYKSLVGMAAAIETKDGENTTQALEVFQAAGADYPSVAQLMEEDMRYKDVFRLFVFADFPKDFDGDSEQPYVLLRGDPDDDESDPIIIAAITGSFSNHDSDGENGKNVVADIMRSSLARFMKNSEDMEDLVETVMTDPAMPKMFKGLHDDDDGAIIFVSENQQNWTWGSMPNKFEGEGFWMSDSCGYGKQTIIEKATKAVRKFGGAKGADKSTGTANAGKPAVTASNTSAAAADATSSIYDVSASDDPLYILFAPSAGTKDEIRDAYKRFNGGIVPTGYKQRPKVKILKKDFDRICKELGVRPSVPEPVVSSNTGDTKNDLVPKASVKDLAYLKDKFSQRPVNIKIVNEGRTVIDPKRMEETEKVYASFTELGGYESMLDHVTSFSFDDRLALATDSPMLAAIRMQELDNQIIRLTPVDVLNKKPEKEAPLKATGTGGSQTASGTKPTGTNKPQARTFGKKK